MKSKKKTKKIKEIKLPMKFDPGKMKYEPILAANKSETGNPVKFNWWWLIIGTIIVITFVYFIIINTK